MTIKSVIVTFRAVATGAVWRAMDERIMTDLDRVALDFFRNLMRL